MRATAELDEIREILAKLTLPTFVLELNSYLDIDSTGWPCVYIWVIVDDEATADDAWLPESLVIRDTIRNALRQAGVERWPYVRFRSRLEQEEIDND